MYNFPNYQFNPMMNAQQRLNYMEQQYPQLVQQPVQSQSQTLITIPVTNIDEANAFRVDLNGTPTFFYNAGANEVYLKKTNTQTGAADFIKFAKADEARTEVKQNLGTNSYEKDFKALNDKIDGFATKIDGLYSLLQEKPQETETKGGRNAK